MRFHIPNMSCGGCARGVSRAIESVDPDARIVVHQDHREVELASDLPHARFASALAAAGYPVAPTTG